MKFKKGVAHLFVIIVVIAVLALTIFLLAKKGLLKSPLKKQEPVVQLKTEYKNPFNKDTQYVNPFDQTKNPFAVAE